MTDVSKKEYFLPENFSKLAEAEASNWWFCSRNRLLLWALCQHTGKFNNLLEIGCGTGFVLKGIREAFKNADLFGSEYFEEGLQFARGRIPSATFYQLDATRMTDADRFDVIGAFDVLEHIEDDKKVLLNLATALRANGTLLITVPQHRWLWSSIDEYACHVRRYSRDELLKKVESAGLRVHYISSFVSLLLPLMWLSRLSTRKVSLDPMHELQMPVWLNRTLEAVMNVERWLLMSGLRFPMGGSILLIGKKS